MNHDTRWSPTFAPTSRLNLAAHLLDAPCVLLHTVHAERVVVFLAPTEDEARFWAAARPFRVGAVCGVLPTAHGPVLSLLWTLVEPDGGWEPRVIHQTLYDPADDRALGPLRRLATQSHWHVAVVGPDGGVHRWAQVENRFQLGEALEACVELARPLGPTDLPAARAAVDARWSVFDVLAAHDPPCPIAGRFLVDDLVALLDHAVVLEDRAAGRAVAAIAHERGGAAAMDLVLATYRSRLGGPRTRRAGVAAGWWEGVGGWRA
ncbi:MAG: hypothetical protein EP329_06520 [Deltaproteobacteria bacterium]|nr:MAG: hypothetical protein EP329_06520 [Deltaproteobacteria bacterium]